jgi:hypothetical protein
MAPRLYSWAEIGASGPGMATNPPDAFLSYTRFDDRRGDIRAFRLHLEEAVREMTGEPFDMALRSPIDNPCTQALAHAVW